MWERGLPYTVIGWSIFGTRHPMENNMKNYRRTGSLLTPALLVAGYLMIPATMKAAETGDSAEIARLPSRRGTGSALPVRSPAAPRRCPPLSGKKLESALESRAQDLRRSLTERSQITVEREPDPFDEQLLAAERESSAQTLAKDFRLLGRDVPGNVGSSGLKGAVHKSSKGKVDERC